MLETIKSRLPSSPRHVVLAGVFCLVLISGLVAVQIVRADGRILPNVAIGGLEVGGLTPAEAKTRLENALRAINIVGVQFRYQDRTFAVRANDANDTASAPSLVSYDLDGMVDAAFAFGHDQGVVSLIKRNVHALFANVRQPVQLSIDAPALRKALAGRFGDMERTARDAALSVVRVDLPAENATSSAATRADWNVSITPESTGLAFDYARAISEAAESLGRWRGNAIDLQATTTEPSITTADAERLRETARRAVLRGDASLAYDDLTWTLPQKDVAASLAISKKESGPFLSLKREVLEPLLAQAAEAVESEPKATSFWIDENGRARDFVGGSLGVRIDREASLARVDEQFATSENGVFPIVVMTTPSPKSDPVAEELGIRELIGYGTSKFSGSPKNRRLNIANGASRLNGLIFKPGEEVSLLEHLRPFNAEGGYLQELVIKNNRTVPEYGGGLCQIGTTTFRAVMGAGLPVTARQNHSYRVVYYEPAGTDATIYDPAPDFKFINDTQHSIVLITKISGDVARFEFWGTRDGRVQEQGPVKIWNSTPPPEPKLIETSELPEGQKKCFESAHAGATTNFTYTITYPDGTVKSQDFKSIYKPWQQQCLIGKAGAPRISLGKDGSINELPPLPSATATPEIAI